MPFSSYAGFWAEMAGCLVQRTCSFFNQCFTSDEWVRFDLTSKREPH